MVWSGNKQFQFYTIAGHQEQHATYHCFKVNASRFLGVAIVSGIAFVNGEASPAWDAYVVDELQTNETKKALDEVRPWAKVLEFGSKQLSMVLLQLWSQTVHATAKVGMANGTPSSAKFISAKIWNRPIHENFFPSKNLVLYVIYFIIVTAWYHKFKDIAMMCDGAKTVYLALQWSLNYFEHTRTPRCL